MKHRNAVIILLFVSILAQAVGALLNRIVISINMGMPTIAAVTAISKWVPINPVTQLPALADVIRVGDYALSIGDLFIITGLFISMSALWLAIPAGRKFFPLLIASVIGIFLSIAEPNHIVSTVLCEIAAVGTIIVMYWSYRASLKIQVIKER
jgi:hypothetical protein